MKIILSRKGVDSNTGGLASPILPDGTLLSLPIPSDDIITYSSINWNKKSYIDIIKELSPKTTLNTFSNCHLDPDLRYDSIGRQENWQPAFGQTGSSLTELRRNEVNIGDIFLFFGWFKETEYHNGLLRYKYKAKDLHVIFGYMQIGDIIESYSDVPDWLKYHPHANLNNYKNAWDKNLNAIYLPTKQLSLFPDLPGCGTFQYNKKIVLTKEGYSRSRWDFPHSMKGTPISHNPNGWKEDYFQSAGRGQEFVINGTPNVIEWVKSLFQNSYNL
jgi:hypothetical protein